MILAMPLTADAGLAGLGVIVFTLANDGPMGWRFRIFIRAAQPDRQPR